jgi:hypothetical protein
MLRDGLFRRRFFYFGLKGKAIFTLHGSANIDNGQSSTFKAHGTTTMREVDLPGDEIVDAFVAVRYHGWL